MGDRGNIVVRDHQASDVYLYTHWGGSEIALQAQKALKDAPDRWTDAPYLARVAFDRMKGDDVTETTGYGISTGLCDNEHAIVRLNTTNQSVEFTDDAGTIHKAWSFRDYIGLSKAAIMLAFNADRG